MTKLKITLHGNLYFWIHESVKMNSAVFLSWFWFIPLGLRKKSLDRKTKEKQKCCKVSVIGKKLFFTISKTSGWLLRRSAKRHLANNYIFVALGGFGKFSIRKNKNKNFAGLEPAEVDNIRFHQHNSSYLTQLYSITV